MGDRGGGSGPSLGVGGASWASGDLAKLLETLPALPPLSRLDSVFFNSPRWNSSSPRGAEGGRSGTGDVPGGGEGGGADATSPCAATAAGPGGQWASSRLRPGSEAGVSGRASRPREEGEDERGEAPRRPSARLAKRARGSGAHEPPSPSAAVASPRIGVWRSFKEPDSPGAIDLSPVDMLRRNDTGTTQDSRGDAAVAASAADTPPPQVVYGGETERRGTEASAPTRAAAVTISPFPTSLGSSPERVGWAGAGGAPVAPLPPPCSGVGGRGEETDVAAGPRVAGSGSGSVSADGRATSAAARRSHHPTKSSKAVPSGEGGTFTSMYRGVTKHRLTGRFEAHFWDASHKRETKGRGGRTRGRQVYLGGYTREEDAARAYDLAALAFLGTSAAINHPLEDYAESLGEMEGLGSEEVVALLRRGSVGFARGASQYRGVTKHHQHGKWEARIGRVEGTKYLYLGTFESAEEAARAYDRAAVKFRGRKAITNFKVSDYADILADPDSLDLFGNAGGRGNVSGGIVAHHPPGGPYGLLGYPYLHGSLGGLSGMPGTMGLPDMGGAMGLPGMSGSMGHPGMSGSVGHPGMSAAMTPPGMSGAMGPLGVALGGGLPDASGQPHHQGIHIAQAAQVARAMGAEGGRFSRSPGGEGGRFTRAMGGEGSRFDGSPVHHDSHGFGISGSGVPPQHGIGGVTVSHGHHFGAPIGRQEDLAGGSHPHLEALSHHFGFSLAQLGLAEQGRPGMLAAGAFAALGPEQRPRATHGQGGPRDRDDHLEAADRYRAPHGYGVAPRGATGGTGEEGVGGAVAGFFMSQVRGEGDADRNGPSISPNPVTLGTWPSLDEAAAAIAAGFAPPHGGRVGDGRGLVQPRVSPSSASSDGPHPSPADSGRGRPRGLSPIRTRVGVRGGLGTLLAAANPSSDTEDGPRSLSPLAAALLSPLGLGRRAAWSDTSQRGGEESASGGSPSVPTRDAATDPRSTQPSEDAEVVVAAGRGTSPLRQGGGRGDSRLGVEGSREGRATETAGQVAQATQVRLPTTPGDAGGDRRNAADGSNGGPARPGTSAKESQGGAEETAAAGRLAATPTSTRRELAPGDRQVTPGTALTADADFWAALQWLDGADPSQVATLTTLSTTPVVALGSAARQSMLGSALLQAGSALRATQGGSVGPSVASRLLAAAEDIDGAASPRRDSAVSGHRGTA